ncbi:Uncharacterized protein Adt_41413 [Abeliophyllum distichum]|uniref:At2g29880-like C-terminal domain-containing protein n=1 Tax=Abeliophyllum distichum TaxID=126358 RepID=A0ABD1PPK7_9LAMI
MEFHRISSVTDHKTMVYSLLAELLIRAVLSLLVEALFQTNTSVDYKDLRIVIENGNAIERHAIGLGNDTNVRTFETRERRGGGSLGNFMYDSSIGYSYKVIHMKLYISLHLLSTSLHYTISISTYESRSSSTTRKQNRTSFEAKLVETNNIELELIDKLTRSIDSIGTSEPSCWDIIREIPNLDKRARFKVLTCLIPE